MKWIYTLIVLFVLSSCSTQQKYSNSRYQKNNNADDAYFSPNDIKYTATTSKSASAEKYDVEDGDYYVNTQSETANPNAANRNINYTQYTQGTNQNSQTYGNTANSNALQWQNQQLNSINNFYQPNWGNSFVTSPFSPWARPGLNINNFNGNWGWSVGFGNNVGNGWRFNPYTNNWMYDPWGNSFVTTPGFGAGGLVYDPWTNRYVYSPWANPWNNPYNNWGWNNPYNNWGWNNPYNPYCPSNNFWGNRGNNAPVVNVRNTRRRAGNNYMPAVRRTRTTSNTGGTRVIGSTELQQQPAAPSRNAQTTPGTVNRGAVSTGTNSTPSRTQPNYRNYTQPSGTAGSNANTTPSTNRSYNNSNANTNTNRTAPTRTNTNRNTPNRSYRPRNNSYRSTPSRTRTAPARSAPRTTPSRGSSNRSSGSRGGGGRRR